MSIRVKAYQLIDENGPSSKLNNIVSGFIVLLIITNVLAVIFESHKPIGTKYHTFFYYFEVISVVIFTFEYLLRAWFCIGKSKTGYKQAIRVRLKYLSSPMALIDLLAIAPFYLSFFFAIDLRYLRMLRMLRLLKLAHYFKGLNLFASVLVKEILTISAAIFTMLVLVILAASIMYSVEHAAQPEVFDSIPSAMWWAVVTMTTVGYGDVTPVTFIGKFIAIFIMLLGVGVVALPAAMLATKFSDELQHRKELLEVEVLHAIQDGIVSEDEREQLNQLSEELDLSESVLEKMIKAKKLKHIKSLRCPHCHKSI